MANDPRRGRYFLAVFRHEALSWRKVMTPPGPRIRRPGVWNGRHLCKAPGVLFGAGKEWRCLSGWLFFVGLDDFGRLEVKYLDIQVENP